MSIRINGRQRICSIVATTFLAGCSSTTPPPLPPNNPADPQVRGSSKTPRNLLARDETTLAIEKQLSETEANAKSASKMEHDMSGMQMPSGSMQGMQHDMPGMNMKDDGMQQPKNLQTEKKTVADEMKKTSDEMRATSEALKQKSEEMKTGAAIYTCRVHPEIQSDKPGNCPKCGMKLVKKKAAHEDH